MLKLIPITILSFFSIACVMMGLALFMLQTPSQKAEAYKVAANKFIIQSDGPYILPSAALYLLDEAQISVERAASLSPYTQSESFELSVIADKKLMVKGETDTAFLPHKTLLP